MIEKKEINKENATIYFTGLITSKELLDINNELIKHKYFTSCKNQLWIFHSVEDITISTNEIITIALEDIEASKINPNIKIALVCDSDLIYGLCRMYEAYSEKCNWQREVFRNLDKAKKWINTEL